MVQIGIDIVDIEELRKKIASNSTLLDILFTASETKNAKMETIAGRFASKEAIIKTGYLKPGEWKKVVITNDESGKPYVCDKNGVIISELSVSISHSDKTAVAVCLYEKNKNT